MKKLIAFRVQERDHDECPSNLIFHYNEKEVRDWYYEKMNDTHEPHELIVYREDGFDKGLDLTKTEPYELEMTKPNHRLFWENNWLLTFEPEDQCQCCERGSFEGVPESHIACCDCNYCKQCSIEFNQYQQEPNCESCFLEIHEHHPYTEFCCGECGSMVYEPRDRWSKEKYNYICQMCDEKLSLHEFEVRDVFSHDRREWFEKLKLKDQQHYNTKHKNIIKMSNGYPVRKI